MAKTIVGSIDLSTGSRNEKINFPRWALDVLHAEGVKKLEISFDTVSLTLKAEPVTEAKS